MKDRATLRGLPLILHPAPLLLVAIFSLLLAFGVQAGLWGLPMLVVVGSWFFKYAFVLLDHVAEGRPGAPVLTAEAANPTGEMRPLAYGLLATTYYVGSGKLADWLGSEAVTLVRLAGLAVLPAIMATQTVTGSLVRALNPAALSAMMQALGLRYLWIVGIALLGSLLGRAIVLDAGHFALVVRIAAPMLLWLATFAALGGVIHDRRIEIGFEPEHSPERRREREQSELERSRNRFIDQVFGEYRAGRTTEAWNSIQRHVEQSASPIEEYAWIHERVAAWSNPRLGHRVALELLTRLLAARRTGEALRLARSRIASDPDFRPLEAAQALQLSALARDAGDRPLARALLRDFDARYSDDAARARARRMLDDLSG